VAEYAKLLEEQGYKEIIITGIEVSSYGIDFINKTPNASSTRFNDPLSADGTLISKKITKQEDNSSASAQNTNHLLPFTFHLSTPCPQSTPLLTAIQTIHAAAPNTRLRLGSLNPSLMTLDFCNELLKIPNVCNHFHLSLQSGCDDTLHRMGRKYSTRQVLESIESIRHRFDDCSITADLITGFPGETDEEFEQTLGFIEKAAFADMHIFPYSLRPGTKASKMPDQVEKSVRKERARIATETAAYMANEFKQRQIGKTVEVLFEQRKNGFSAGHSTNYLEVSVKRKVNRNSIESVSITSMQNGRLTGEVISVKDTGHI